MVAFRKATAASTSVTDWWDDGANQIAFGRGNLGFVVINREDTPLTRSFATQMAEGRYCDVVSGDFSASGCSGSIVAVDVAGYRAASPSLRTVRSRSTLPLECHRAEENRQGARAARDLGFQKNPLSWRLLAPWRFSSFFRRDASTMRTKPLKNRSKH